MPKCLPCVLDIGI